MSYPNIWKPIMLAGVHIVLVHVHTQLRSDFEENVIRSTSPMVSSPEKFVWAYKNEVYSRIEMGRIFYSISDHYGGIRYKS